MALSDFRVTMKVDEKIIEAFLELRKNAEFCTNKEIKKSIKDLFDSTEVVFKDKRFFWKLKEK